MIRHDWRSLVVSTVTLIGVTMAVSAWGHGRGGFGPFGGGRRGAHLGGLLEQLVFPCRAGCVDGARTCNDTAHSAAVTCAEQGCDTQIQAARTACQPDVASTACQTARTALVQCTQPCVDTAQSAGGACRTTLETCLTSCGNS